MLPNRLGHVAMLSQAGLPRPSVSPSCADNQLVRELPQNQFGAEKTGSIMADRHSCICGIEQYAEDMDYWSAP